MLPFPFNNFVVFVYLDFLLVVFMVKKLMKLLVVCKRRGRMKETWSKVITNDLRMTRYDKELQYVQESL